mgnify:CR=1 FL=1
MVKMIPAEPGKTASTTETDLWHTLSKIAKEDWVILHSLDINQLKAKEKTEIDFVVFIPKRGIVLIECKGATHVTIDGRKWELEGVPPKSKNSNPFDQLDASKGGFRNLMLKNGFQNIDKVPIARLVWLPKLTGKTFVHGANPGFSSWEVALYEELSDPAAAILKAVDGEITAKMGNKVIQYKQSTLTPALIDEYLTSLNATIEISADLDILAASRERLVEEATSEQKFIIDLVGKNRLLYFEGAAGTGKTVMLTECAKAWKAEGRKVLYVCYNELLAERMQKEIGLLSNIDVMHFNELLLKLAGGIKNPKSPAENWFDEELPKLALEHMAKTGYRAEYEGLCIDEFQDLAVRPHIYEAIIKTVGGTAYRLPKVAVAADDGQQITANETADSSFQFLSSKNPNYMQVSLTTNCRQSPKLSMAIASMLGYKNAIKGHRLPKNTEGELEIIATTPEKQGKDLYRVLTRLMKTYKPENIRVLSPYGEKKSVLALLAKESDLHSSELRELKKLTAFPKDGGKIHWRSVRKFKGLEDDVVVITDVSQNTADWLATQNNTLASHLYVGLSRARFHAVVLVQDDLYQPTKPLA